MMYGDGWGSGGWIVMGLMMLLFWSTLIVGGFWLFTHQRHSVHPSRNTAREILDERFARGEIDADEYRGRREALDTR